jgi:SpoVK/Ycf46/Vps4 family AAA+-type ATPase
LGLPAALAAALGYHDGQLCAVEPVLAPPTLVAPSPLGLPPPPPHLFPPPAEAVVVEPLTESDWELVELNAGLLESGALLAQVGVVAPGQPLPLWARRNAVAALRVVAASPPGQPVLRLVPGTEVAIAPKPRGRGGGGGREAGGGAVPLNNGEAAAAAAGAPPAAPPNGRASTTPSQPQTTVVQEVREASDGRLTPSAALSRSASMVNGAGAVAEVAVVAAAASSPPSSSSARWILRVQDPGDAVLVTWDDVVDHAAAKGGGGGSSRARRRSGGGEGEGGGNNTTTPQQPASSYVTTAVFVSPSTASSLGLPLNAMVRLSVAPEMAAAASAAKRRQGGASSSAAAAQAVLSRAVYALLPDATGQIASPGHVLMSPPLWKAIGAAPGAYVSLSVVGDGAGVAALVSPPPPPPLQLLPRGCSLHPLAVASEGAEASEPPPQSAAAEQALAGLARRLSKDEEEGGGEATKSKATVAAPHPPSIGPWAVAAWACMQAAGVLRLAGGGGEGELQQEQQRQQPKPAAGKPPRPPPPTATAAPAGPAAAATTIALPLSSPALMQVRLPGAPKDGGGDHDGGQDLLMLLVPSSAAAPASSASTPPPPISASALLTAASQQVNLASESPSSSFFLPPPSADLGGSLVAPQPPPLSPAAAAFAGGAATQQPQLEHLLPASTTTTSTTTPAPWLSDETARAVRHVAAALDPMRWLARRRSGGVSRPATGCLLISGPRGSGKTSLLRLLGVSCARHPLHRAHALRADCRALAGQPFARAVRALSAAAAEAAARAPSVLLLDDLDSLCFATPDGPDPALAGIAPQDAETAARLAEWLSDLVGWLGGFSGGSGGSGGGVFATPARGPVALVASARDAAALPASLRAAGRFDSELRLPPLGAEGRAAVLRAELARLGAAAADERDVAAAASAADSCDANDLRAVAGRAVHAALARRASAGGGGSSSPCLLTVTPADLTAALRGFVPAALWSLPPPSSNATNQLGWADIGGMDEAVAALKEVLSMSAAAAAGLGGGGDDNTAAAAQRRARLVARAPLRLRTGLLLYGPPGCGKTHAVKCAAQAVGARLLSVKGPELLNKYIGASEAAVRDLFSRAAAAAPCALFFDEFDALAPPRGHDSTGVTDRVVNQLLTELDGVGGGAARAGVVVLAATSRPDLVDAALLRPGRLDRLVACDFPDEKERLEILRAGARKVAGGGLADEDLVGVAAATAAFSGADLAALLSEAQLAAVHEELERREEEGKQGSSSTNAHRPPVVTGAHLLAAARKARPSLPPPERARLARVYARFASGRDPALDNRELAADLGSVGVRATLA